MPIALILKILAPIGTLLVTMGTQLLTEAFLKKAVVIGLRKIVAKTENKTDDELLKQAEEAWGTTEKEEEPQLPLSK